ncbi:hypothetical protein NQ176_g793 [Zarea fungicola]|uniref:Uncharacterized protein n=1 Tax=Zarea fungicola TaxID=93591 RepID=A0ACC1NVD8_9HYPO|nr:hypothetical protein NQ176_g793 [Lecanicillium fungicola]
MSVPGALSQPLSVVLPPLILGTATFNHQYHPDPAQMPYAEIVRRAIQHNIAAFDTSPYYGPSEVLLGDALRRIEPAPPRDSYFLITKAGRIAGDEFDYPRMLSILSVADRKQVPRRTERIAIKRNSVTR